MSDHNKCPSSEKEHEKCIFRLSYFHRIEPIYMTLAFYTLLIKGHLNKLSPPEIGNLFRKDPHRLQMILRICAMTKPSAYEVLLSSTLHSEHGLTWLTCLPQGSHSQAHCSHDQVCSCSLWIKQQKEQ